MNGQSSPTNQQWQQPGSAPTAQQPVNPNAISPAGGFPKPLSSKEPTPYSVPSGPPSGPVSTSISDNTLKDGTDEDLIHIKKEALDELLPLIDKLNQKPAEQFKTLMMIIQASDNQSLINRAYTIAQGIDDQKIRAQALLDIINEINYFTQQPEV
jgi:hypothetical protein